MTKVFLIKYNFYFKTDIFHKVLRNKDFYLLLRMCRSKSTEHLGLLSGMIDGLDLVNKLNNLLETDGIERQLSLGLLIKALILKFRLLNYRPIGLSERH